MPAALLDLLEETMNHFREGARSVRAYSTDTTYVITRDASSSGFWVAIEEEGFVRRKVDSLTEIFQHVFGIQATY